MGAYTSTIEGVKWNSKASLSEYERRNLLSTGYLGEMFSR
jgi:hypothetical protein